MMHISNGSCEALSAAFLLWDQPGALDADVLTTNEIRVIVILWISILQTAPNILLSHSRGVFHLVWLTEFVLIPLFFAFKLVTWLKKNKTFWPILLNRVCKKCVFLIFATMARKVIMEGISLRGEIEIWFQCLKDPTICPRALQDQGINIDWKLTLIPLATSSTWKKKYNQDHPQIITFAQNMIFDQSAWSNCWIRWWAYKHLMELGPNEQTNKCRSNAKDSLRWV